MKKSRKQASPTNSKSAKSIKSRVSFKDRQEPVKQIIWPYFNDDPIRDQINERAGQYRSKSKSPVKARVVRMNSPLN